jgi:pimeloyl-ACP methyl ester carboxylesterase
MTPSILLLRLLNSLIVLVYSVTASTSAVPHASEGHASRLHTTNILHKHGFNPNMTEYWFDAVVDHFNFRPTLQSTFPLRYLVNDQYYANSSSPVLFYAGNEANIYQFVNNSGFLWEAAIELQAMIVFAEHRYYGKSFPFNSPEMALTPKNISYLTVEQAMADFNTLQVHIRERWKMVRDTAFIVAGGSYGGNLALWLRLKNPNLWAGALASSATPLKHVLRESNAFAKIVADVYGNVSTVCPDMIRLGWRELLDQVKTAKGKENVRREMNLCHIPEQRQPEEIANEIHGWVAGALETMVQYGYPYPTNFFAPVPGYPFKVACQNMMLEMTGLGALRAAAQIYYNYTGQAGPCFDWLSSSSTTNSSKSFGVEGLQYWDRLGQVDRSSKDWWLKNQSSQSDIFEDWTTGVSWGYQCCTEVYQPMPTNGVTDLELPYQPNQTEYFERCSERWEGVTPRPNWEEMTFMSDSIQAGSNIFLSSGQLDPWRAAGIQVAPRGAHESIIVRIIEGGAHHLDLRASHPMDPESVRQVRKEELLSMRQWIAQWRTLYPPVAAPSTAIWRQQSS